MKELGEAINKSLSDSGPVSAGVFRIKEDGYDPFLVLEATIGVSYKGEQTLDKASAVSTFSMGLLISTLDRRNRQSRDYKARRDTTPQRWQDCKGTKITATWCPDTGSS